MSSSSTDDIPFLQKAHRARILIESARFPPFGFDITEISSSSTGDIPFLQKDLSSKLDLGTIKNGSAASDLPPEGPPKERWVELNKISMIWRPAYLDFSNLVSKS